VKRSSPWGGKLRRDALVDAVIASTSIEGYRVSPAEARSLVDGIMPRASDGDNQWAVACYARAMEHVQVMSDDPMFEWGHRVVLDLHFDACQFQRNRKPGKYRDRSVHVSAGDGGIVYTAPDAHDVPELMTEALDWLRQSDGVPPIIRAAMAHLHFVSIHPFRDGNGRVGRILQSLVLARAAILAPEFASIEPYLAAHTSDYYAALQTAQNGTYAPTKSAVPWLEFCVHAHLELGRGFEARMHALARYWRAVEQLVAERRWPDRTAIAIDLAMHEMLTRSTYVAEAETPLATAALDLRRLDDAGYLTQRGAGRSTSYVASDALRDAIEQRG
jgi:Fic family protein